MPSLQVNTNTGSVPFYDREINFRSILLAFIIFPLIKPSSAALIVLFGSSTGELITSLLSNWNILSIALTIILFFGSFGNRIKPNVIDFCFAVVMVASLSIGTFIFHVFRLSSLVSIVLNIILIFMLGVVFESELDTYVSVFYRYIYLIMFFNSLSIYTFFPKGMYVGGMGFDNSNYYLFGLDNVGFLISIVGTFLGGLLPYLNPPKYSHKTYYLKHIIISIFILGAFFYVRAGTGMAIITLYAIIYLLILFRKLPKINYRLVILFLLTSFMSIVILNTLGFFEPVLNLIGKDATFSGRTSIWAAGLRGVLDSPIFGHGIEAEITMSTLAQYGPYWVANAGHLHNVILEYLFKGGVVSLLSFLGILALPLFSRQTIDESNDCYQLLLYDIVLLWLVVMFEYRLEISIFWLLFIINYRLPYFFSFETKD